MTSLSPPACPQSPSVPDGEPPAGLPPPSARGRLCACAALDPNKAGARPYRLPEGSHSPAFALPPGRLVCRLRAGGEGVGGGQTAGRAPPPLKGKPGEPVSAPRV